MEKKKQPVMISTIITRDFSTLTAQTENIYKTVALISKRARQIAVQETEELHNKLTDFITNDVEDLYDEERAMRNEQTEITILYEKLPSPCIRATEELPNGKLMYRYTETE